MLKTYLSIINITILSLGNGVALNLKSTLSLLYTINFTFRVFFANLFIRQCHTAILGYIRVIATFILSIITVITVNRIRLAPAASK